MIYFVASVAAIAGLLFGYDEGIIAGALEPLRAEFQIGPLAEGLMTATVPLGALVGAAGGGFLTRRWGRRRLLLGASLLFVIGALACALAPSVLLLSLGRLILGIAIGVAALVAPLYISEMSPASQRGRLVSIYQLAITLGIFGAYLVGFAIGESWRGLFATAMVPGIMLFVGVLRLTDTPRWLVLAGRRTEAKEVIAHLGGMDENDPRVAGELGAIEQAARAEHSDATWRDLLGPLARPALIVGTGLFLLQQLSGINAVIYFAPTVFGQAGFDGTRAQLLATVGIGAVNVLMTLVAMALIDRIGRRKLLFIGFAGAALSLGFIAFATGTGMENGQWLTLTGLVLYIASFAIALGPLPWVMMSEIFPLSVRGLGMGAASLANWGFNFLVVLTFPILLSSLGLAGVFSIYALVCVAGLFFTARYVPETSGLTLEEIEAHLKTGKPFHTLAPSLKTA